MNQFSHLERHVLAENSTGLLQAYLHATETPHGYLLDLSQDTDDRLRFGTCIFPDEAPHLMYVDIGNDSHKYKLPHSSRIKKAKLKLRKAILLNCDRDIVNCISECVLNVLNGHIALTGCEKHKLIKHKLALSKLVN